MAINESWYCKIVGMELGPMSFDDLVQLARRGTLLRDHPVRKGEQGDWRIAETVAGLCSEQDPSAAMADFEIDQVAIDQVAQIPPESSLRVPEQAPPTAAAPATKREWPTKPRKPVEPMKPTVRRPGKSRSAARSELKFNTKPVLVAACLAAVSLAAWGVFRWQGQRPTTSVTLTDPELVNACRELHQELNRARDTQLTAQNLTGFEMQFQRRIQSLRSRAGDASTGSVGQTVATALAVLGEMPRCAVSSSNSAAYQERERKLEGLLAQASEHVAK